MRDAGGGETIVNGKQLVAELAHERSRISGGYSSSPLPLKGNDPARSKTIDRTRPACSSRGVVGRGNQVKLEARSTRYTLQGRNGRLTTAMDVGVQDRAVDSRAPRKLGLAESTPGADLCNERRRNVAFSGGHACGHGIMLA